MTVSPAARRPPRRPTVSSVAWPAGTMTQTDRGGWSAATRSSSEAAGIIPSFASASSVPAERAVPTTRWPPRIQRRAMLPPILPRPTIPISIVTLPRSWRLESLHLAKPAKVALLAGEAGSDEGARKIPRQGLADDAGSEAEDVHVVVLHALMRAVGVVAEAGPHAADLVGRDRGADAAAADENAPLGLSVGHRVRHRRRGVGVIVVGVEPGGAQIEHRVPVLPEHLGEGILEGQAGMIASDRDFHPRSPPRPAPRPPDRRCAHSPGFRPRAARSRPRPGRGGGSDAPRSP